MDQAVTELELRTGYIADPACFAALADLLRDTFDIDIAVLDRLGGPDPTSMPFGYFDANGRCVANFSAVEMPLVINGRRVRAVGYQSGAVRPDYRGQGLYRDLMRRAFAWARKSGFEIDILLTDKPRLYEPYGFRSVPQHSFLGYAPEVIALAQPINSLSLDNRDDLALIQRLLATRQPVSDLFAITGHGVEFLLNTSFDSEIRLGYLQASDAIVAWRNADGRLELLDIVAAVLPSFTTIAAALGAGGREISVCFPVDRLDWAGARAQPYAGICDLMIAAPGDFVLPDQPFMLSPMADF